MRRADFALSILCALLLSACGGTPPVPQVKGHYKLGAPYTVKGRTYYPKFDPTYDRTGIASWYGDAFHGKPTANGERFDKNRISAAHPTLPLPSIVEVTNLENGRRVELRVNDRGPFVEDRLIDLSEAAARELGFKRKGLAKVRVRFMALADADGTPPRPLRVAVSEPPRPRTPIERPAPAETRRPANSNAADSAPAAGPAEGTSVSGCATDGHYVQVAALSNTASADEISRRLVSLGSVWIDEVKGTSRDLYRLRLGPLNSRSSAFDMLARIYRMGYEEAYVVSC